MSADNVRLGQLISHKADRDAIHIAVMPVVAAEPLGPGVFVRLSVGNTAMACSEQASIGIVDPFLSKVVNKGEQFWLCLKPGSITSLRHVWTHPNIERAKVDIGSNANASRIWLEACALRFGWSFEKLLNLAEKHWAKGDFYCGDYSDCDFGEKHYPDIRHHLANIGVSVPQAEPDDYFRCGC